MWGQDLPFILTTADDVTNGTEKLYYIESNGATGFFAIPMGDNNDSGVSTSNMPNAKMLWYIMDASDNEGTYYYIINKSTGKYLRLKGNNGADNSIGIASKTDANDTSCKFSLGGSEGKWLIQPKSGNGSYYVNKKGSNVNYTNGLKSSSYGSGDLNSEWKFIAKNDVVFAHPFTNSTANERNYYLIKNRHKDYQSYYLSTDNDYVSVSNSDNDNRVWYFVEASSDDNIPQLKYYYIVNANTDKYVYFNSNTVNGNSLESSANAVDIRTYTSGDEDRYQFAIVNAKGNYADYVGYSIIPKKLNIHLRICFKR